MDDDVDAAHVRHLAIDHTEPGVLRLRLSGRWTLDAAPPSATGVFEQAPAATRVSVDSDRRLQWDSGLLIFLRGVLAEAQRRQISVDLDGLPPGALRLVALASAAPDVAAVGPDGDRPSLLSRIGPRAMVEARSALDALEFVGEAAVDAARLFTGAARFRRSELLVVVQGASRPPTAVTEEPPATP